MVCDSSPPPQSSDRDENGVSDRGRRPARQTTGVDVSVGVLMDWSRARGSPLPARFVEVIEDSANDGGVDDEGENFHLCPTVQAIQRVDVVDAVDELRPAFAQSTFGRCELDVLLGWG